VISGQQPSDDILYQEYVNMQLNTVKEVNMYHKLYCLNIFNVWKKVHGSSYLITGFKEASLHHLVEHRESMVGVLYSTQVITCLIVLQK
jgi:hypothetical protein